MNADELRAALKKARLTIAEFGRLCLVGERTAHRWVSRGEDRMNPPPAALLLLDLCLRKKLSKAEWADAVDRVRKQLGRI